jgi:GAF domain-containing protein
MVAAPPPANEAERLRALQSYDILDSAPEAIFDAMTELAANMCDVPIALVTLVDEKRQWFKSNCGLSGAHETQRSVSFCAHAILGNEIFEVPDAAADPRFADNPLVTGEPHIRFYAGAPIRDEQGLALGTLCVVDRRPRLLTHAQRMTLERSAGALGGVIATRARRSLVDPAMLTFFDTALREANERAAHLDALQDLAHCLNDADPATILDIALEAARQLCRADTAAVFNGFWDKAAWPSAGSPNSASAVVPPPAGERLSIVLSRGEDAPFSHSQRTLLDIIATMAGLKLSGTSVAA